MRKIVGVAMLLVLAFALPLFGQSLTNFEKMPQSVSLKVTNRVAAAVDSTLTEGTLAINGELSYSNVNFTLQVATRGANDSLQVVIQCTNNPADTTSWQTLTAFDTRKAAIGSTVRVFPTGAAARDSTLPLYRFFRVTQDHSIDAFTAADTSTWFLHIRQFGERIR